MGSGVSAGGVARLALAGWLLGHGVPLATPTDRISLVPLAVTCIAAWRVARAGVHASRAVGGHRTRSLRPAIRAVAAVALVYAGLGAAAGAIVRTAELSASPLRAAVTLGCFGLVAALLGVLANGRAASARLARLPSSLTAGVRAGVAAALLLLATGAGAAGATLAVRGGEAAEMLASYRAGVLGQAGITVVCLAYAPNLAVWGAAYLLGPGFAVGVGTAVSPGAVALGPLPAVPALAALPSTPASGVWTALIALPLAAGMSAGALLALRPYRGSNPPFATSWGGMLGAAALAGPVAGLLLQLTAFASAGAMGSGRLAQMGPSGWDIGLAATLAVSIGAVLGAATTRASSARRR
jgi:hypothetical protein